MIKKVLPILLIIVLLVGVFYMTRTSADYDFNSLNAPDKISVVSFNCAAPWGNILEGTGSSKRVKLFATYMNTVKPDIIGTQEMNSTWLSKLEKRLDDYEFYAVKRGGDDSENKSEMNALFWNKEKFECLDSHTFWLSETPSTVSKYTGAACYRICSFVVLVNKATGEKFIFMNTHLDHVSEDARVFGARTILDKLEQYQRENELENAPVILTGDFNSPKNSEAYTLLTTVFTDASTSKSANIMSTYNDWGKLPDEKEPIDFIFTTGTATNYITLCDISNGYVSDHYGIYSVIAF